MAARVEGLLGERVAKGMWILTFHSTCARLLRREHAFLGVPSGFTIYDDGDTERLIDGILKDLDLDPKRFAPRAMASGISAARRTRCWGPTSSRRWPPTSTRRPSRRCSPPTSRARRPPARSTSTTSISETVRLFRDHPEVLAHYQERFRYLMVDEYQDTNRAQYELVNMLSAKYRNVCVVGDADQGVYSWRGATIQNILDFERDYPDAQVFLMEQNYRSTQNILEIANALIEHNRSASPRPCGPRPATATSPCASAPRTSTTRRSSWPTRSNACASPRATGTRDFAIFYRTNAQSRVLEDVLMRIGTALPGVRRRAVLPAQGDQGRPGLPAAAGQPARRDLVPPRGEHAEARHRRRHGGGRRVVRARRGHPDHGGGAARGRDRACWPAARRARWPGSTRSWTALSITTWTTARARARMVEFAGAESGYLAELEEERTVEAQGRIENLQELVGRGRRADARANPTPTSSEFLEQVSLVGEQDEYDEDASAVTLMTLHIAKGLEFPVVFMVGMEDGIFPHYRSMTDSAALEEERRLAYVGITRAQQAAVPQPRVEPHAVRPDAVQPARRGSCRRCRRHLLRAARRRAVRSCVRRSRGLPGREPWRRAG